MERSQIPRRKGWHRLRLKPEVQSSDENPPNGLLASDFEAAWHLQSGQLSHLEMFLSLPHASLLAVLGTRGPRVRCDVKRWMHCSCNLKIKMTNPHQVGVSQVIYSPGPGLRLRPSPLFRPHSHSILTAIPFLSFLLPSSPLLRPLDDDDDDHL
jgi:hypothetical protein